jgi:hypothetical protein
MTTIGEMTPKQLNENIAKLKGFEFRKAPELLGAIMCWYCVPENRWYPTGYPDWVNNFDDSEELMNEINFTIIEIKFDHSKSYDVKIIANGKEYQACGETRMIARARAYLKWHEAQKPISDKEIKKIQDSIDKLIEFAYGKNKNKK